MLTPEQRRRNGRLGALKVIAEGKVNTSPAREAFAQRFYRGIPEDLPAEEQDRRAAAARAAYFLRLSIRAAEVRSARARRRAA